jgi:hypothetical protein
MLSKLDWSKEARASLQAAIERLVADLPTEQAWLIWDFSLALHDAVFQVMWRRGAAPVPVAAAAEAEVGHD